MASYPELHVYPARDTNQIDVRANAGPNQREIKEAQL